MLSQGKAFGPDDEGDDNLVAVAALIAGVAAPSQIVFLGESLEIATGQVVLKHIVRDLKECAEALLEIVLDGDLGLEQWIESAIKAILAERFSGNAHKIVERRGRIPVLGQGGAEKSLEKVSATSPKRTIRYQKTERFAEARAENRLFFPKCAS